MKLTTKDAKNLLKEFSKNPQNKEWITHSICVGNCAYKIAKELGINANKARVLGYIHDIGKGIEGPDDHVVKGYVYIKSLGYDSEYANICLTHSYLNHDVNCTLGGIPNNIPYRTNFIKHHKYSIYEKIINICDLMCGTRPMTLEKRIIDIVTRRGLYPNSQYQIKEAFKLKKQIDKMLGYDLYELFPHIK